jgi:hypothetical protein
MGRRKFIYICRDGLAQDRLQQWSFIMKSGLSENKNLIPANEGVGTTTGFTHKGKPHTSLHTCNRSTTSETWKDDEKYPVVISYIF